MPRLKIPRYSPALSSDIAAPRLSLRAKRHGWPPPRVWVPESADCARSGRSGSPGLLLDSRIRFAWHATQLAPGTARRSKEGRSRRADPPGIGRDEARGPIGFRANDLRLHTPSTAEIPRIFQ